LLARVTRARTLPLIWAPVAVGAALSFQRGHEFHARTFLLSLIGAGLLHLGLSALNDLYDERSGADRLARVERGAIATSSGALSDGLMSEGRLVRIAAVCCLGALGAGITVSVWHGWALAVFGAIGFALGWQYSAPPLRYGYRGMGELGVFAAYGILPVLGSYYGQTGRIERVAFAAAVVPGLLTTIVFFTHNTLHWRPDKGANKITPVVLLGGPENALIVAGLALTLTYVTLPLEVAFGVLPVWSLSGLLTTIPVAGAWTRAFRDPVAQNCLQLLGAILGASVLTSTAIAVSLAFAR